MAPWRGTTLPLRSHRNQPKCQESQCSRRETPAVSVQVEYNIERFYAIARNEDKGSVQIRYPFRIRRSLVEASPSEKRHAERALDALRFLGLIFAGFAVAAVSKLVGRL